MTVTPFLLFIVQVFQKKVKVALGGDAADELFAGYDTFKAIRFANLIKILKLTKTNSIIKYLTSKLPTNYSYMNLKFKLDRFLRFSGEKLATSHGQWLSPLNANEINQIFEDQTSNEELYLRAIDLWQKNNGSDNIDKVLSFILNFFFKTKF